MIIYSPTLFIEVNNTELTFAVGDIHENNNFKIIYKSAVQIQVIENSRIADFELILENLKKNIYLIEQKLNFIFNDAVLIINNFNCSFINITGYKKLNGSQILKDNITYILNSLKANVDETENKKSILHIFNSKYILDKKEIKNLPIGLFGDFYSHELSFCLINNNDYKSLKSIFEKCNIKIKKIFLKSYVEGSYISKKNKDIETFFYIKINENNSQIIYFENDSLKFEENFNFGTELVLKDISKITFLKIEAIKSFLNNFKSQDVILNDDLVEKEFFNNENFRKIKKKIIFDIAEARIEELTEIMLHKNINFKNMIKKNASIFLKITDKDHSKCFIDKYSFFFSKNNNFSVKKEESFTIDDLIKNTNQLAHYGWKKEAIPVIQLKKSTIARFFDAIFG